MKSILILMKSILTKGILNFQIFEI
jgi:hypothetical protein